MTILPVITLNVVHHENKTINNKIYIHFYGFCVDLEPGQY